MGAANVTLTTAMHQVFGKRAKDDSFTNPRKRADLIVLADATISGVATEQFDEKTGVATLRDILIVEVKRGGAEISRENVHQASDYVEDILKSGLLDGSPHIRCFVVGHSISLKIEPERKIGSHPVHVLTYGQLTRTAQSGYSDSKSGWPAGTASLLGPTSWVKSLPSPRKCP